MLRFIGCMLLYSTTVTTAFPFPFPAAPAVPVPVATPVKPTAFPFAPGARPLVPGVNNPYYNYAGAPVIPIVSYSSEHGLDGTYSFSFSTADGKQAQESGYLKDAYVDNTGNPQGTQVVQGSYAYISPDGTPIQVSYVADENGFRPSGVHISANGKRIAPIVPVVDRVNKPVFDPTYNRYDLYNRYNNLGQYNNHPYDPRYPYHPRYPFDPKNFNAYVDNNNSYQKAALGKIPTTEEALKNSA